MIAELATVCMISTTSGANVNHTVATLTYTFYSKSSKTRNC